MLAREKRITITVLPLLLLRISAFVQAMRLHEALAVAVVSHRHSQQDLLFSATSASFQFLQLAPSRMNFMYKQRACLRKLTALPRAQT